MAFTREYFVVLLVAWQKSNGKRALQVTGSGRSLHDPVSMCKDESMAFLKEKLAKAEKVCVRACVCLVCTYVCVYFYCLTIPFQARGTFIRREC